jgi:galactokinase
MAESARERTRLLTEAYARRFPGQPTLVRAPGRVNLIGEHTDYNDGFVLPIAINRDVRMAVSPREDRSVRLYSIDFDQEAEFSLDSITPDAEKAWSNYVRGVAKELEEAGHRLRGMQGVVQGNVPIASGLSSSAALEICAGLAFEATSGLAIEPVAMARLAQQAEHHFMGVRVGIMDQFVSRLGQTGHALLIDTRSLEQTAVPFRTPEHVLVIADSRQSRELAGSAYNERRAQCEEAVARLAEELPGIRSLRDVDEAAFLRHSHRLSTLLARRARHVVGENARVLRACEALSKGELERFGAAMNESHESLRYDYEVSSPALDLLVGMARQVEGCRGARLTGAGFGGCVICLVHQEQVDALQAHVARRYEREFGMAPFFTTTGAEDGAGLLSAEGASG